MNSNRYLILVGMFCCLLVGKNLIAQAFDPFIQSKVDELSYDSLYLKMQAFEDLGVKEAGTASLDETGNWIIGLYEQYGYEDIEIDSFSIGPVPVYNIIITKTGTVYPYKYVIIDAHYDTYNGPGVNDNGTGTAIVLEMARMMKDMETEYSIKFIHFSAEELGLLGSYHYVNNTVIPQDLDIRLVFNIDEVGGVAGEVNNTITCERDEWPPNENNAASAAFTDTLANLTELYSNLDTYINYAYGTDYVPFMENGYVVTGFYEYNESNYPHTINDSLSNLDPEYVFEVTKASLAGSLYFSGASETISGVFAIPSDSKISVSPNPFDRYFNVTNSNPSPCVIEILDLQGRTISSQRLGKQSKTKISPKLSKGIYFYRIFDQNSIYDSGKLIKK